MPRCEVKSPERHADHLEPSRTVDVCNYCYKDLGLSDFHEGDTIPQEMSEAIDGLSADQVFGSLAVEHPPYADGDLLCEMCDDPLDEDDDSFKEPSEDDTDLTEEDEDFDDDEDDDERDDDYEDEDEE